MSISFQSPSSNEKYRYVIVKMFLQNRSQEWGEGGFESISKEFETLEEAQAAFPEILQKENEKPEYQGEYATPLHETGLEEFDYLGHNNLSAVRVVIAAKKVTKKMFVIE